MSLFEKVASTTPDTGATPPPAGDATPATPVAPITPNSDWYYDENIKGSGDRPEWLKDKYKTAADQAKAYIEVEKKLGAFKGAPDKYDLSLKDYPEVKFADNDPLLAEFLETSKKNGVSQEYVTEILNTYAQALTINVPNADEEFKKLGPNAQQDLQILSQWAGNYLSKDEFGTFKDMITTADSFRIFDKLRQSVTQSDIAVTKTDTKRETVEEVKKLVSDPRYDTDSQFRDEVRKRLSVAMQYSK